VAVFGRGYIFDQMRFVAGTAFDLALALNQKSW